MSATRYLLIILRAVLLMCWVGTAIAGSVVAFSDHPMAPLQIDPVLTLLTCITSTLAGATTLAIRVNNLLMEKDQPPLVRPWLFAISHMLGSWLAGLAAFIAGRVNSWDAWNSLLVVLLMSFAGAKGLEKLAEKYLPVVRPPAHEEE